MQKNRLSPLSSKKKSLCESDIPFSSYRENSDFCTQNHAEIQFFVIFTQYRQVYILKEAESYAELYTIGFSLIKQNLISN